MQTNLEQVTNMIRNLPIEDLERLRATIDEERRQKLANGKNELASYQVERYKKARKWLDEHGDEYMNQWVCLEGDKLIAHGPNGLEVDRKAREAGIEIPFVHHIVPEVDMFGW